MTLPEKIDNDLKASMSAKDALKTSVLRFLKSALKYQAIEKKVTALNDADAQQVIQKQIKQRRESIDQFTKAGRQDLADQESKELKVLESYLPKQMEDSELEKIVKAEIESAKATSKKDFGRLMGILTGKLAGQADGRRLSEMLGKYLK